MNDDIPDTSEDTPDSGEAGERIAKVLARAGICSRRDAEKMIDSRRVAVNGKVLTGPAVNVTADDVVTVDGAPLKSAEPARLWRYHKAPGIMTTHKDPQGRPTVFDRLPREMPRVISVGRLDLNSEGLLLLTNDGELARALEHPSRGWMRRYRVRVYGRVDEKRLQSVANGVTIEGVRYGPIQCELDHQQGSNAWIVVSIAEGKNREVRRVMEHLGYTVNRLIRVSYGPFALGRLPRGEVDEISGKVLRDYLGGLGDAVPPELRRGKVQTEKWAKAKPKTVKPGERARERAIARGEGFKKGQSTSKYAVPAEPEATIPQAKLSDGRVGDDRSTPRARVEERPFWQRAPGEGEDRPSRPQGRPYEGSKPSNRKPAEGEDRPRRPYEGSKPSNRKPAEGEDRPRRPYEGSKPSNRKPAAEGEDRPRRPYEGSKPSNRKPAAEGEDRPRRPYEGSKPSNRKPAAEGEDRPRRPYEGSKPSNRKPVAEGEDRPRRPYEGSKPSNRKPAEGEDRPRDDKPRDRKPGEGHPRSRDRAEDRPRDDKPRDRKPADRKPADRKPAEGRPSGPRPSGGKPAGGKSPGGKSIDRRAHGPSAGPRKSPTRRPKDDR